MKNRVIFAGVFLAAFLIFMVAKIPAQLLVDQAGSYLPQLKISGVEGTAWCGSARQVSYGDQTFEAVEWSLSPFGLLLDNASLDVESTSADLYLVGTVDVGLLDNSIAVEDMQLRFPIAAHEKLLGVSGFDLQGGIKLTLNSLSYAENTFSDIDGQVVWQQAGMGTIELGDLQADFVTEAGELSAQLKDLGGPLSVEGSAELENSGKYKLKLVMAATDPANSGLQQTLRMLGKQASDGKVYVDMSNTIRIPQGLSFQ